MTEAKSTGQWVVGDEEGVLFTGTEEEMQRAWIINNWEEKTLKNLYQEKRLSDLKAKYKVPRKGKLTLAQL